MIRFEEYDNSQERYACNSCHNFKEHKMYKLLIGLGNGGQLTYLCPKCAKELKQSILIKEGIEDLMKKYDIPDLEYLEKCIIDHDKYGELQEQLGCSLDVFVKAFKKYVEWTTDCDFGYNNIPDEYEKYKNDKKFKTLTYDSGLIYIAIQEVLNENKEE